MSTQHDQAVTGYLNAAGTRASEHYNISTEELGWLLGHIAQENAVKLRALTALQHALPQSGPGQEMKETLTNVIIMQTRLKDREDALAKAMQDAAKSGTPAHITVNEADIRELALGIVRAGEHVWMKASKK